MVNVVMKGFRFADTLESCFESWKRSHMACSALLFGRFADSQESRFSKRSNMSTAVLEGCRSADIHELYFQVAKRSHMYCAEMHGGLFVDCQECNFHVSKRSDNWNTILEEGRIADVHEEWFQGAKRGNMCSAVQQ